MPRVELFRRDLEAIATCMGLIDELRHVINKLVNLYALGQVKTNHSVMEVVVAGYLYQKGYEKIDVERKLPDNLTCDVYAEALGSTAIVEVETGFTPPSNALDPLTYLKARIASKIARYSVYADKMILAIPPYYAAPIPAPLLKPPKHRTMDELVKLKELVDNYYRSPPIPLKLLSEAKLHTILIVDVDECRAYEVDPETYYRALGEIIRHHTNHIVTKTFNNEQPSRYSSALPYPETSRA